MCSSGGGQCAGLPGLPAEWDCGRHPCPSAKGALCCYQVQTAMHEAPSPHQHLTGCRPGLQRGWCHPGHLGWLSAGYQFPSLWLPLLHPAWSCYYNAKRASESHAQLLGGPASHWSGPSHAPTQYLPLHLSNPKPPFTCSVLPPCPPIPWGPRLLLLKKLGMLSDLRAGIVEGAKGTPA